MTLDDINRLFNYLAIHYENNPKVHSKRLQNAWLELLEPYDPKDVKAALLECLREKRFFPDAPDVAAKCRQYQPQKTSDINPYPAPDRNAIKEFRNFYEKLKKEAAL